MDFTISVKEFTEAIIKKILKNTVLGFSLHFYRDIMLS